MYEVVPTREKEYKTLKHNKTMTILELQKKLQEMYEKYGDVEVVVEDTDCIGIERYHDKIFIVKNIKYNGNIAVALANS